MAKRSPILGYNHNVKYRGLIFHVQTEDSGLLSPHLFTHLFHGGVIISTRKLVYDAGSAEDAIKGLMQAQHKVVLKDLKGGKFDDKIDQYLVGTEGLEPRSTPVPGADAGPPRPSEVELDPRLSEPEIAIHRPETDHDIEPIELAPMDHAPPIAVARTATPPPIPRALTPATAIPTPRTQTAERKSAPTAVRTSLPPPPTDDIDPPTNPDAAGAMAEAMAQVNATVRTPMPDFDSAPEIQILEDDAFARARAKQDEVSDGVPGVVGAQPSGRPQTGDKRPNALAAGALPPARPITRPPSRQAMAPPAVMSRPLTASGQGDGERSRSESDAVEVYAPAPPSIDAPPGVQPERPGQYAQHKRVSQKMSVDVLKDRPGANAGAGSGSVPIPAGLARPGRPASSGPGTAPNVGVPQRVNREQSPGSSPTGPGPRAPTPSSAEIRVPAAHERPPERPRTPTPARISPPSSGARPASAGGSGGVVMTRPAVIVGAPAKQASPPRVRKAREEEGRGFGQGLISEKSLDEVILAYLSEDADEK